MAKYGEVLEAFGAVHRSEANVWAHLACATAGLIGVGLGVQGLAVAVHNRFGKGADHGARLGCFAAWAAYVALLAASGVGSETVGISLCVAAFAAGVAAKVDKGLGWACLLVAFAYAGQDAAHWYFGEATYQAKTWGAAGVTWKTAAALFVEHVFWLLPLTLDCASHSARTVAVFFPVLLSAALNYVIDSKNGGPWSAFKKRVLIGSFASPEDQRDLRQCRAWMVAQKPHEKTTSHWWVADLDAATKSAFQRLVSSKAVANAFAAKFDPREYTIEPVHGMNELYVSAPCRAGPKTSDDVFFTEHVDGPYCFFPGASIFRFIVALDANTPNMTTHFPLANEDVTARDGDFVGFDFHRESHYITMNPTSFNKKTVAPTDDTKWRMVLKLHYVTAPKGLFGTLGRLLRFLSVKYNEAFRALFLATITPTTVFDKMLADVGVNGTTVVYNALEKYVGFANLFAALALAALSTALGQPDVFLYATSFVHYGRYMSTYYVRKDVAYGAFKRDVLFYKTLAVAQLAAFFLAALYNGPTDALTFVSTQLAIAGYFVSIAATQALGIDGTYFGIELGHVKADYKFVTKFPYNMFPHPMILGQVTALAGMHLKLRATHPYLAPIHIALYLTHMLQEVFDYHDGIPWYKKDDATKAKAALKKRA